ncbi:MAG: 2-oxo acid dehydrogenase subunit E2 [Myxococcales bacterium]|nr:2-oxo acid dehydrogenase subunit E2 [Myxococcales bacterium]
MSTFAPIENASSFRRMAAAMWRAPSDPSIYGSMDVDATEPLAFLAEHQRVTGVRLTVTHLVARAVALALHDQPEINGKIRFGGRLEQRSTVDVFVTVATEGNKDLSGARIDRADEKPLAALATELAERVRKIRGGEDAAYQQSRRALRQVPWWLARAATRLSDVLVNELHLDLSAHGMPSDPFGSAIVTSVGMFGIDSAFAPFVPLARCPMLILVPEIRPRPWAVGDRVEVRPVLRLCATFDHRLIDGAAAGRFANRLTQLFATPQLLA